MNKKIILFIVFFTPFLFLGKIVNAASLDFSPNSGTYHVGDTLSATIYVSSVDQTMNATEGEVSFPADLLKVSSLSNGSIISISTPGEPSFSNTDGTVNFGGVDTGSGYKGSKGKVITINFKIKAKGVASLSILNGSILANDGNGTEIISSVGNAKFNLIGALPVVNKITKPVAVPEPEIVEPTIEPVVEPTPAVPPTPEVNEAPVVPVPVTEPVPFYFNMNNIIVIVSFILFVLLFIIIYFWHKYYKLRHIVDQAIFEEQKEKNRLFELLNMDIAEKERIMEKLRVHKKLTDKEVKVIMEVEKKYQELS